MGIALVFAVASAILLGLSDFSAARAALDTPSLTVTRTAVTTSVTLSPLLLLVVHSEWTARDTVIGLISGVAMITGLSLLYEGYKVARLGIVAPLASVLIAAVPVLWDILHGTETKVTVAIGMAIGAPRVRLAEEGERRKAPRIHGLRRRRHHQQVARAIRVQDGLRGRDSRQRLEDVRGHSIR